MEEVGWSVSPRVGIARSGRTQRKGRGYGDDPSKDVDNRKYPPSTSPATSRRFDNTKRVDEKRTERMAGDGMTRTGHRTRLHSGLSKNVTSTSDDFDTRGTAEDESSSQDIGDSGDDTHGAQLSDEVGEYSFKDEESLPCNAGINRLPGHHTYRKSRDTRKGLDVHEISTTEVRHIAPTETGTKIPNNGFIRHRDKLAGVWRNLWNSIIGENGLKNKGFIVAVVLLVLSIVASFYTPSPSSSDISMADDSVQILQQRIHVLQKTFSNQSNDFWHRINVILRRGLITMDTNEARPTVLLLVSSPQVTYSMNCLAQHVGSAYLVNSTLPLISISGNDLAGLSGEETKMRLDNLLNSQMAGVKGPAAVVSRIDVLPPEAMLIFYKYCDHESAQYPSALLVFTILHQTNFDQALARSSLSSQQLSRFQEEVEITMRTHLLGNYLNEDKFGGLWSRIGINVLPVITEEKIQNEGCPVVNW